MNIPYFIFRRKPVHIVAPHTRQSPATTRTQTRKVTLHSHTRVVVLLAVTRPEAAEQRRQVRAAPRPDPPGRRSGSSAGTAPAAPRTRCPDAAAAVDVPDMGDDDVQCGEQRSRCPRAEWSGTAEASARLYVGVVSVCVTGIGLVVEPDAVNKGLFGADGCTRPHQPASGYWHGWYSSADRTGLSNPAI
jgi:hypothetical protein